MFIPKISGSPEPTQQAKKYSDAACLLKLSDRSIAVCCITIPPEGGGTGFLIGKDLIMTNHHVLDSRETARKAKALFFYTSASKKVEVDLDPDLFFHTSRTPDSSGYSPITIDGLDFTIVALKSHPKIANVCHFAFSIFNTPVPQEGSHANIIHHPEIGLQKVSFRENLIKEVTLTNLHYTTATRFLWGTCDR